MRRIILALVLIMALTPGLFSQQNSKPLSNQDVISMAKNLLPESVILAAIKSNDTDFDVSATGLIALKKAGVTPKVMEAMLAAANNKKNAASAPPPAAPAAPDATAASANAAPAAGGAAPAWQPLVSYLLGNNRLNLTAEATQIVSTKAKPTSLSSLAGDQVLDQALQVGAQAVQNAVLKSGSATGSGAVGASTNILSGVFAHRAKQAKTTYVWALNGGSSPAALAANAATFEVNYAGVPGVKPDQFEPVIVKLSPTPQANFRLVGATEAATNAEQSTQQDWPIYSSFVEDRVAAKVEKLGPGRARVTPSAALPAGEYAVALRPVDRAHKFSGEEVGKNQGEGLLFNYAWSFSVK